MEIRKTDCLIYRYYNRKLHVSFLELFDRDIEIPEFCDRAVFYFESLCTECKYYRKRGDE